MDAAAFPIFTVLLLVTQVFIQPSSAVPGFHYFSLRAADGTGEGGKESSQIDGIDGRKTLHKAKGSSGSKVSVNVTNTNPDTYKALQAWKKAITHDPYNITASWVGPDVCSYDGIYCSDPPSDDDSKSSEDSSSGSSSSAFSVVSIIDLNNASIRGHLVDELSLLTNLSTLHLNSNCFNGTFPSALSDLKYLTEIDLSNNCLSGTFPKALLSLPSLTYVDLRFNNFTGKIPAELFNKPNLDAVFLNNNQFDGDMPSSLWESTASVVSLANNRLAGKITSKKSNKTPKNEHLQEFLLFNNNLTGCVAKELGNFLKLNVLDLSNNSLTGGLPNSLSCLKGMEVLNLGNNMLSGVLPDAVCELSSLVNLTVSNNYFTSLGKGCTGEKGQKIPGFDVTGNCVPDWGSQKPQPQCQIGVPTFNTITVNEKNAGGSYQAKYPGGNYQYKYPSGSVPNVAGVRWLTNFK